MLIKKNTIASIQNSLLVKINQKQTARKRADREEDKEKVHSWARNHRHFKKQNYQLKKQKKSWQKGTMRAQTLLTVGRKKIVKICLPLRIRVAVKGRGIGEEKQIKFKMARKPAKG